MKKMLAMLIMGVFYISFCESAIAVTIIYDFSGENPLASFINDGSYQVTNEQLHPPLVADFYNTTLLLKSPVVGGAGNQITLTADFLYDTSLINSGPAEIAGLSLFLSSGASEVRGEMRAIGDLNIDVVAYSVSYDVNSRNEGNPIVNLTDNTWYKLVFTLDLIGGTFNDQLQLTTSLYELSAENEILISSISVDSYNFRMLEPETLIVGLNAQGSAGIAAIDNFTVVTPILLSQLPVAKAGADQVVFDTVTLDGSASYDLDGTIESYNWTIRHITNSEINTDATGATPTVTGLTNGFYDVCLTVTDDLEATDTNCSLVAAAGSYTCTASTMSVDSIVAGTVRGSKGQSYGEVQVTVSDDCGNPVAGATVTGTFTDDFNETSSGATGANGAAVIRTIEQVKKPLYEFCVGSVEDEEALVYVSDDNIESCGTN